MSTNKNVGFVIVVPFLALTAVVATFGFSSRYNAVRLARVSLAREADLIEWHNQNYMDRLEMLRAQHLHAGLAQPTPRQEEEAGLNFCQIAPQSLLRYDEKRLRLQNLIGESVPEDLEVASIRTLVKSLRKANGLEAYDASAEASSFIVINGKVKPQGSE